MTILAVIGLSVAAVIERTQTPGELREALARRDSTIAVLRQRIAEEEVGFFPCWRGEPGETRNYFFAYDITFADGAYELAVHRDFATGARFLEGVPADVVTRLRGLPQGRVTAAVFSSFGQSVSDATENVFPPGCRLAVTINQQATGEVIATINRAGFYPVYR